jgi:hypothetical protein
VPLVPSARMPMPFERAVASSSPVATTIVFVTW